MTALATPVALDTSWWAAAPSLVLLVVALWVPGALMARLCGGRGLVVAAVAPVLTLGVLSLAVAVAGVAPGVVRGRWSAGPVGALLVLAVLLTLLGRRLAGWRAVPERPAASSPRGARLDAWSVVLACAVSGASTAVAIGSAGTPEQSNDSPFHLAAAARVAATADPSWGAVRATTGQTGFYPPLFDVVLGLVARTLPVDVVVASNLLVLVLVALVWPLGVDALVRAVITTPGGSVPRWHPERVGRVVAMALVVATAAFPAQLVAFGALWPNLLGLALVPAVLAALVDLTHPAGRTGHRRRSWTPALAVVALALGGSALALAHPDAVLSAGVIGSGLLLAALVRGVHAVASRSRVLLLVVVAGALGAGALLVGRAGPLLASVVAFHAVQPWSLPQALAKVALLDVVDGTRPTLTGPLALVGAVCCLVRRRHRWLVVGWVLAAAQVVLAGAVPGPLTGVLTGAWYREPARLSAALAVPALVLAAIGVLALVVATSRVASTPLRRVLGALLVVTGCVVTLVGIRDVYDVERDTYQGLGRDRSLVTPTEAALYARTLAPGRGDGLAVVGDPFGGAMFAALYSGRPTPVTHFGQQLTGPAGSVGARTGLVVTGLRSMTTDLHVCDAVRALRIGYVVEDTPIWTDDPRAPRFAGLRGLAGTPGLTLVGRDGGTSVYRVTACRP